MWARLGRRHQQCNVTTALWHTAFQEEEDSQLSGLTEWLRAAPACFTLRSLAECGFNTAVVSMYCVVSVRPHRVSVTPSCMCG